MFVVYQLYTEMKVSIIFLLFTFLAITDVIAQRPDPEEPQVGGE